MVRPPYYVAVRLCTIAAAHWIELDGDAAGSGVDPFGLRFDRLLNHIYVWAIARVKDPEMWVEQLNDPPRRPAGARSPRRPSAATLAEEADSFVAFMADYRAAGGR